MNFKKWLHKINRVKCPECGCRETEEVVTDTLDGHLIMEMGIFCVKCGACVNYWAHGFLEFPDTYTELIPWRTRVFWDTLAYKVKSIPKSIHMFLIPCSGCGKKPIKKVVIQWEPGNSSYYCKECGDSKFSSIW